MTLPVNDLELKVLRCLQQDKKTHSFVYLPERPGLRNENTFQKGQSETGLPDVIRSGIYRADQEKDFRVIIKTPQVEFSVLSKNFTFNKVLTR